VVFLLHNQIALLKTKTEIYSKKFYNIYTQNSIKGVLRDFLAQKHINLPTDTQNALQSKKNAIRETDFKKLCEKNETLILNRAKMSV
jgi:hypothetical protein